MRHIIPKTSSEQRCGSDRYAMRDSPLDDDSAVSKIKRTRVSFLRDRVAQPEKESHFAKSCPSPYCSLCMAIAVMSKAVEVTRKKLRDKAVTDMHVHSEHAEHCSSNTKRSSSLRLPFTAGACLRTRTSWRTTSSSSTLANEYESMSPKCESCATPKRASARAIFSEWTTKRYVDTADILPCGCHLPLICDR